MATHNCLCCLGVLSVHVGKTFDRIWAVNCTKCVWRWALPGPGGGTIALRESVGRVGKGRERSTWIFVDGPRVASYASEQPM